MLCGPAIRDTSLTAVWKCLVQYSKTSDSSYNAYSEKARLADTVGNLVLGKFVHCTRELAYRRHVCVAKQFCHFLEALRHVGTSRPPVKA